MDSKCENVIDIKMKFDVYEEKEYKKYNLKHSIGAVIMCKNEEKRILVTLQSVLNTVNCVIMYDTGSTDSTKEKVKEFCKKNRLNLHFIQGDFVDFSTSRNVLLEYADTIQVEFLLLLDVNDEIQGGDELIKFIKSDDCKETDTGFLLCQTWKCYTIEKYFNVRFVKARNNWRYRGVVHEYITNGGSYAHRINNDEIIVFQDRTADDDKSGKRFVRDKVLLLDEFKKEHSIRSANIICDILKKHNYSKDVINKVRHLVEGHEFGGDEEQNILMDADSLAYFDYNIPSYLKRNGRDRTKEKIRFMYKRLTAKGKKLVDEIKFEDMYKLLEEYPSKKIVLTGANDEEYKKFGLEKVPYEIFTLKHNPEKSNPEYYRTLLKQFNLEPKDVIYFEHNKDAMKSAQSVGIQTYFYDKDKKDLEGLRKFIDDNL